MAKYKHPAVPMADIAAEYMVGATIKELAPKHGVSEPTMRTWLRRHGVEIRRGNTGSGARNCTACGDVYRPNSARQKWCPACVPNKTSRATLRRYGVTQRDWNAMHEAQDGKCALCEEPFANAFNTCLDHCHDTGAARGLVCRICNMLLSKFDNDPDFYTRVKTYRQQVSQEVSH